MDVTGAEIAGAIEYARRRWAAGQRSLKGVAATPYRAAPLGSDVERLSRVLSDSRATPSDRAAATVVLAATGDEAAVVALRTIAESMAKPERRIALKTVVNGADDAAVAKALAALDEVYRGKGAT